MPNDSNHAAAQVPEFKPPPKSETDEGKERRIGVEIEFGDVTLGETVGLVQRLFGGEIESRDPYRSMVNNTRFGDFLVELDTIYAHPEAGKGLRAEIERNLAERVGDVAKLWLPMEIAAPPIPLSRLGEMERLIEELRRAGATGTDKQLYYAFGMQFNPELASLDAGFVVQQFKAYLLLEDWLRAVSGRDIARRVVAFANPFPRAYAQKVLAPGYDPDWDRFIDDYLTDNPTRNRDLDMLPLMSHVDEARVMRRVKDKRIKTRPTFHYRVPDSRVDEATWSLTLEWNRWVEVEYLAEDTERLEAMRKAFLDHGDNRVAWADETAEWL